MTDVIKPGNHEHEARNGYTLSLDQQLSPERLDLLAGLMEHHGYKPNDVTEAHFYGDGVVFRTVYDMTRRLGAA